MGGIKIMKYYKSKTGKVYAYDDSQKTIKGLTPMTDEELQAHLNPPKSKEQKVDELKSEIQNLDFKRIRPLAEKDDEYLNILNIQILTLRQKLKDLQNG